jgi:mannose-6-phosphate isomerase-like protein (cupin superfamily)
VKTLLIACALVTVGCGRETATTFAVLPSAHHRFDDVWAAADALNDAVAPDGAPVFLVAAVERQGGEAATIEQVADRGQPWDGLCSWRRVREPRIRLKPSATVAVIAHEMGHAAGLRHHPDPTNLMHAVSSGAMTLTTDQIEHILSVQDK